MYHANNLYRQTTAFAFLCGLLQLGCSSGATCGSGTVAMGDQCVVAAAIGDAGTDAALPTSDAQPQPTDGASELPPGELENPADPVVAISIRTADSGRDFAALPLVPHMYLRIGLSGKTQSGRRIELAVQGVEVFSGSAAAVEALPDLHVHTLAVGNAALKAKWVGKLGELTAVATLTVGAATTPLAFEVATAPDDTCMNRPNTDATYFPGPGDKKRTEATVPVGAPARLRGWISADARNWFNVPPSTLAVTVESGAGILVGAITTAPVAGDTLVRATYLPTATQNTGKIHTLPIAPATGLGRKSTLIGPRVPSLGYDHLDYYNNREWRTFDSMSFYTTHTGPDGGYAQCVRAQDRKFYLDPPRPAFEIDGQTRLRATATGTGVLWLESAGFQTPILLLGYPNEGPTSDPLPNPVTAVRVRPAILDVARGTCQALQYEADMGGVTRQLDAIDVAAGNWSEKTATLGASMFNIIGSDGTKFCPPDPSSSTRTGIGQFWWLGNVADVPMTLRGKPVP
jgi:hypothetical protein